jgi:hypothetical protein
MYPLIQQDVTFISIFEIKKTIVQGNLAAMTLYVRVFVAFGRSFRSTETVGNSQPVPLIN